MLTVGAQPARTGEAVAAPRAGAALCTVFAAVGGGGGPSEGTVPPATAELNRQVCQASLVEI